MIRIRRDSLLVFFVCIGISSFVLISLESQKGTEMFFGIGPIRYVQYLCYALLTLGCLVFLQGIQKKNHTKVYLNVENNSKQYTKFSLLPALKIISLITSFLIFMFFLEKIGFIFSGILLMLLTAFIIRGFSIPKLYEFFFQLLFSIVTVLFIYISFDVFMMVDLP